MDYNSFTVEEIVGAANLASEKIWNIGFGFPEDEHIRHGIVSCMEKKVYDKDLHNAIYNELELILHKKLFNKDFLNYIKE